MVAWYGSIWYCASWIQHTNRSCIVSEIVILPRHITREWSREKIQQLSVLWCEGLSAQAIAVFLNTTKGAVTGKANRIGLPARPSPIKRSAIVASPVALSKDARGGEDAAVHTPLSREPVSPESLEASLLQESVAGVLADYVAVEVCENTDAHASDPPSVNKFLVAPPVRVFRLCSWPIGEPGTPGFRFCSGEALSRRTPYCAEHHAVAYVRPGPRRIDSLL